MGVAMHRGLQQCKAYSSHGWTMALLCILIFVHLAIEELKGPSGLDENGVSLFKTLGMKERNNYNFDDNVRFR